MTNESGFRHGCGDEIQSCASVFGILRATCVIRSEKDKQFFTWKIAYFETLSVMFLPF